ncbi:hypothetical protein BDV12DRAFT_188510 [Aspergillus spectabilis]
MHGPGAHEDLIKVKAKPSLSTDEIPPQNPILKTKANPLQASTKHPEGQGINQGDDISGVIESVGPSVWEFAPGDRVAASHRMCQPHGSYAQFAIAPASTTFKLPLNIHEAESKPAFALESAKMETPILIYGGASAVGAYAIKLAKLSGLGPIITVAGNGVVFVESLNAAEHIIDYRHGNVVEGILAALNGRELSYAFDAVPYNRSYGYIVAVLQATGGGHIDMVDPPADDSANPDRESWQWPEGIKFTRIFVSSAYGSPHHCLLAEGRIEPHPYEVQPGGLESVARGFQLLRDRKVSASKLVYRISDTPNLTV